MKDFSIRTFYIFTGLIFVFAIGAIILYILQLKQAINKSTVSSVNASKVILLYQQATDKRLAKSSKEKKEYKLIFVGDIMLSRLVASKIKDVGKGDNRFPFLKSAKFLRPADITFGNLEGPISSRGKNQGSRYSFRANPNVVKGLVFAGFDVMSLANNHTFDWGNSALLDTVSILNKNKIIPIGAGKNYKEANRPAIIRLGKTKIAFLGYTDLYPENFKATNNSVGISDFNENSIKEEIKKTEKKADIIIISFHWGDEYKTTSNKKQRRLARMLIDSGADIIIGHHPHVTEEIEYYKNKWIAYSLGNFVFDQDFSQKTMEGMAIEATIKNNKVIDFKSIPIKINSDFQPIPFGL